MRTSIIADILKDMKNMKGKSSWPDHPAAQAGIVNAESGQLMRTALNWKYKRKDETLGQEEQLIAMRIAAVRTAAAAIRFLENL